MDVMANANIVVLMVTQVSSNSSITMVVPSNQGKVVLNAQNILFEIGLFNLNIDSINLSYITWPS